MEGSMGRNRVGDREGKNEKTLKMEIIIGL
jgi:hypothetical protein